MLRKRAFTAVVLLFALLFSQDFVPLVRAQDAPLPTPDELDQLLAPVALYPDSLLAQITTASTNPQEILDVDNWLLQNSNLSGEALTNAAQAAGFDPAFIALVNFPQVVTMMAENIDDYAAIGPHFLRTRRQSPLRFSGCALKPMLRARCAATTNFRWKCSSPPRVRRSTSSSRQIRKWFMFRFTIPPSCTSLLRPTSSPQL